MTTKRMSYEGVVAVAPVTVPYIRYSHQTAHWWLGRALKAISEAVSYTHLTLPTKA